MIGSLVGWAKKDPADAVMSCVSSGIYTMVDNGFSDIVIFVHPSSLEEYKEKFHAKVIELFGNVVFFVGEPRAWEKMPEHHMFFVDEKSIENGK